MNVMRMAFLERRRRNLDKPAVFLQRFDILGAAVTHTGTYSADQLEYGILYRSLVRHTALDALWHKLLGILLEIAVLASIFHR